MCLVFLPLAGPGQAVRARRSGLPPLPGVQLLGDLAYRASMSGLKSLMMTFLRTFSEGVR